MASLQYKIIYSRFLTKKATTFFKFIYDVFTKKISFHCLFISVFELKMTDLTGTNIKCVSDRNNIYILYF